MTQSLLKNLRDLKEAESEMKISFQNSDLEASTSSNCDYNLPFNEDKQREDYLQFLRAWDSESGSKVEEIEEIIFNDMKMSQLNLKDEIKDEPLDEIEDKLKKFEELQFRDFEIYDFENFEYLQNKDDKKIEDINNDEETEETFSKYKSFQELLDSKAKTRKLMKEVEEMKKTIFCQRKTNQTLKNLLEEKEEEYFKRFISLDEKSSQKNSNFTEVLSLTTNLDETQDMKEKVEQIDEEEIWKIGAEFEKNASIREILDSEDITRNVLKSLDQITIDEERNQETSSIEEISDEEMQKKEYHRILSSVWDEETWMGNINDEDEELSMKIEALKQIVSEKFESMKLNEETEIEESKEEIINAEEIAKADHSEDLNLVKWSLLKKLHDINLAVEEIDKIKEEIDNSKETDEESESIMKIKVLEEMKEIEEIEEMKKVVEEMKKIVETKEFQINKDPYEIDESEETKYKIEETKQLKTILIDGQEDTSKSSKEIEEKNLQFNSQDFNTNEANEEEYLQTLLNAWNEEKILRNYDSDLMNIEEIKNEKSSKEEVEETKSSIEEIEKTENTINEDAKNLEEDFEEIKSEIRIKNPKIEDILNASMEELSKIDEKKKLIEDEKNEALENLSIEFQECQKLMEEQRVNDKLNKEIDIEMGLKKDEQFLEMPLTKVEVARNIKEKEMIRSKFKEEKFEEQQFMETDDTEVTELSNDKKINLEDNEIKYNSDFLNKDLDPLPNSGDGDHTPEFPILIEEKAVENKEKNSADLLEIKIFNDSLNNLGKGDYLTNSSDDRCVSFPDNLEVDIKEESDTLEDDNKHPEFPENNEEAKSSPKDTTEKSGYDSDDSLLNELTKKEEETYIKGKVYDFDPKKDGVRC